MVNEKRFSELLSTTIQSSNQTFIQARRDLNEVVAAVSDAINSQVPQGYEAYLHLGEHSHTPEHLSYSLSLAVTGSRFELGIYRIPSRGYPIEYGVFMTSVAFDLAGLLSDKDAIEDHFANMLGNQQSALVVNFSYMLRRLARP